MARKKKQDPSRSRAEMIAVVSTFALLVLVSVAVPVRTQTSTVAPQEPIDRGPQSYFHHIYDPHNLLGPVGSVDLALDTFQRATTHTILVAGFESLPADDPDFTIRVAERWRPGTSGSDNGMVLFVFTRDRRVRAEVGYGLEEALPDAELLRILDEDALPAFRKGDFAAGLEGAVARICERVRTVPPATKGAKVTPVGVARQALRGVPRLLRTGVAFWLACTVPQRLGLAFFGELVGIVVVALLLEAARALLLIVHFFRSRRDLAGAEAAGGALLGAALQLGRAGIILFVIALGGSYFFGGTGSFGGGGVDVPW